MTIDEMRRAIVKALEGHEGLSQSGQDMNIGVIRGLVWAICGKDPGPYATLDNYLRCAGIPFTMDGDTVVYSLPGESEWPGNSGNEVGALKHPDVLAAFDRRLALRMGCPPERLAGRSPLVDWCPGGLFVGVGIANVTWTEGRALFDHLWYATTPIDLPQTAENLLLARIRAWELHPGEGRSRSAEPAPSTDGVSNDPSYLAGVRAFNHGMPQDYVNMASREWVAGWNAARDAHGRGLETTPPTAGAIAEATSLNYYAYTTGIRAFKFGRPVEDAELQPEEGRSEWIAGWTAARNAKDGGAAYSNGALAFKNGAPCSDVASQPDEQRSAWLNGWNDSHAARVRRGATPVLEAV